ncbi:hypothetical protein S40288_09985 [Stachybotrys chartarum IBT 40288]|nr:hypothetical protein S40288_09985 [Stachybotrys chartarum IBT 40288]
MNSDDPSAVELSPNYETSWKEVFRKLVKFSLFDQMSVDTWDDKEVAGNAVEEKRKDGRTPLSWVAGEGREAFVRLLLDRGANIKSKDRDSRTPLRWATEKGHQAVVQLL